MKEIEAIEKDYGIGEITIKVDDGRWLIRLEGWTRNPSIATIHEAIEENLEWAFRGVEQQDVGDRIMKQIKKIRLV